MCYATIRHHMTRHSYDTRTTLVRHSYDMTSHVCAYLQCCLGVQWYDFLYFHHLLGGNFGGIDFDATDEHTAHTRERRDSA